MSTSVYFFSCNFLSFLWHRNSLFMPLLLYIILQFMMVLPCLQECAFELYSDFTLCITSANWRKTFDAILEQANVNAYLVSVCPGFRDVVAYVLPKLLLAPIYHCFYYIEQIEVRMRNTFSSILIIQITLRKHQGCEVGSFFCGAKVGVGKKSTASS